MLSHYVRRLFDLLVERKALFENPERISEALRNARIARLQAQIEESAAELDESLVETIRRMRP